VFLLLLGRAVQKTYLSPRCCRFKADLDEIWQDYSSTKYSKQHRLTE